MEKNEITLNIRFTSKQDLTFKITLTPENTVSDLKALCVEQSGLDISEQRMVFKGFNKKIKLFQSIILNK